MGSAPLLMIFFGTFLAVLFKFLNNKIPKFVRPPYSVVLFVIGLTLGALNHQKWFTCEKEEEKADVLPGADNQEVFDEIEREREAAEAAAEGEESDTVQYGLGCHLGPSIDSLTNIDPEVIILVMLPPILFLSTFEVNWHVLKRTIGQSIVLAFPGVFFSLLLLGAFMKYAFTFEWSWPQALLVGSILAATDPVAVVAALKELGAPDKLTSIIEGESLLNDGSAFVCFILFNEIVTGESDRDLAQSILYFFQLALGGPLWGCFLGWLSYLWLRAVYNDLIIETNLSICGAYLVFYTGQEVLDVSPVLSVVCYGYYFAYRAKFGYSPEVEEKNVAVWEVVAYVSESLIFIIAGLIIWQVVAETEAFWSAYNWIMLLILFLVLNVVRFLMVIAFAPILTRMGGGLTLKEAVIVGYGGLRGAVSLSLALIVHSTARGVAGKVYASQVLFFIAGLIALTLIVNGMTCETVYNALKMAIPSESSVRLYHKALSHLDEDVTLVVTKLRQNWFYSYSRWDRMLRCIPRFQAVEFRGPKIVYDMPKVKWLFNGGTGGVAQSQDALAKLNSPYDMEKGDSVPRREQHDGGGHGSGGHGRTGVSMYVRDSWIDSPTPTSATPPPMPVPSVTVTTGTGPRQRNNGGVHFADEKSSHLQVPGGAPRRPPKAQQRSIRDLNVNDVTRESVMFLEMDDSPQAGPSGMQNPYQQESYYDDEGRDSMASLDRLEGRTHPPPYRGGQPSYRQPISMHERPITEVLDVEESEKYGIFFNALRASYHSQYHNGVLADASLQRLLHAVDASIDEERLELKNQDKKPNTPNEGGFGRAVSKIILASDKSHNLYATDSKVDFTNPNKIDVEFQILKRSIELPTWMTALANVPVLGMIGRALVYEQLHFAVSALISYINAHYAVISNFDHSYTGVNSLKDEVMRNIQEAKEHINRLREAYPDLLQSITTVLAVSMVLRVQRDKLQHLTHEGVLDGATATELSAGLDEMLAKLKDFYKPIKT